MKTFIRTLMISFTFALGMVLLCSCAADAADDPDDTEDPGVATTAPTKEEQTVTSGDMADEMLKTIFKQYAQEGGSGSSAYINLKEHYGNPQSGYLWSNFSGVGMQYYVCKLYPDDQDQKEVFRKMIENFKYYRQNDPLANSAPNSVKYHSGRGASLYSGSGDCYFDDNIWVARNYLRAYELLGDERYLKEAIRVNNWVLSGWNDELGGIVWSERGLSDSADEQHLERGLSANACGIIVNATLSTLAESGEDREFYMSWAEKFYTFCKKMQNTPTTYDYWNGIHTVIVDGVRKDGDINRVHYAYNSGMMILADLLMYDITGDQNYYSDAKSSSAAAKRTFYQTDTKYGGHYYEGDPWFAAILCEAYYELYKHDGDLGAGYLDSFGISVTKAYGNRDNRTGLCPYQATRKVSWDQNETWVIHQVGYAAASVIFLVYLSLGLRSPLS